MSHPGDYDSTSGGPAVPRLLMRGIRKSFAGGEVLHGVDLTLATGQIRALVGHNGAGKSTLMKVLGGVYNDYGGEIRIDGRAVRPLTPHQALALGIAVIYQDFALVPDLTVGENIALGREPAGLLPGTIRHREIAARAAREAETVGIELPLEAKVRQLGVADQQLTEIVKALARNARILVMDEPTARLSPGERDRLFEIARRLKAAGVSIIYISHFLEEVFAVADLITVLRDGLVVAELPPSQLDLKGLTTLMIGEAAAGERRAQAEKAARERSFAGTPALEAIEFTPMGGRPVSFSVHPGEILGIAGLVGAGRTRLARALIGDIPASGEMRLSGATVRFRTPIESARAGVLLLPEDRKRQGLVLTDTVAENLSLTAMGPSLSRLGIVSRRKQRDLVGRLVDRFRVLPPEPNRIVNSLSGGNQQKVLAGRGFGAQARVLILDQPTAGVDVGAKAELHEQIVGLSLEGVAVIVISDELDELLLLSDRVLVMHDRRAVDLQPARLFTRQTLLEAITKAREGDEG